MGLSFHDEYSSVERVSEDLYFAPTSSNPMLENQSFTGSIVDQESRNKDMEFNFSKS